MAVVPPLYVPTVLDALFSAVFPLVCPGCGRHGAPVCGACAEQLRPAPPGLPPPGVEAWWAAFAYEGVAREIVARVKYRGVRGAVPWLAEAMVRASQVPGACRPAVDVVTWAPTSTARRRARGFDPAELLARAVARRLGVRTLRILERVPGPPQTGLTGADRRVGPRHVALRSAPSSVLVVDDVATTGATFSAAARALHDAGAHAVVALSAARTPPPRARPDRS